MPSPTYMKLSHYRPFPMYPFSDMNNRFLVGSKFYSMCSLVHPLTSLVPKFHISPDTTNKRPLSICLESMIII